ncbi:MAG: DUF697 domain-containing protein [Myxococcota bacterium]
MAWWKFWRRKQAEEPSQVVEEPTTVEDEDEGEPVILEEQEVVRLGARNIIHRNVYLAMGASVLPFPLIDTVALTVVQLKMIKQLATHYEFPFRKKLARSALISLVTGAGGVGVGGVIASSLAKSIPGVGSALGGVSAPFFSGMLTYAVGRTFALHFGVGGTLLDFDPDVMRAQFRDELAAAREAVEQLEPPPSETAEDPPPKIRVVQ